MTEQIDGGPASGAVQQTGFHGPWLLKIVIMFVVLAVFGTWGLWDAVSVYPKRGRDYAEYAEWQYLEKLEAADAEDPTLYPGQASVDDPAKALASLSDGETLATNRADAADTSSRRTLRAQMELARRDWLTGLSRIGALDASKTTYADREAVRARAEELRRSWSSRTAPAPLEVYDIPSQWAIMGVSYAFAAYIALLFFKVAAVTYKWDPAERRLFLPGGASFTPRDMADFDKRKWDKFIVFVTLHAEHPTLAGRTLKFDTYRHGRLEGWLIEMEREQFPEQAEPVAEPDAPVTEDAAAAG